MPDTEILEREFDDRMLRIYVDAKRECGYNASRFAQMISERGGLATARFLLAAENLSDGFTALYEFGRLDLTVEHVVLETRWQPLFTTAELAVARGRLEELGVAIPEDGIQ